MERKIPKEGIVMESARLTSIDPERRTRYSLKASSYEEIA